MDEHEVLIEYSEMTTFNFNSKEFQEVQRDLEQCKNVVSKLIHFLVSISTANKPVKIY